MPWWVCRPVPTMDHLSTVRIPICHFNDLKHAWLTNATNEDGALISLTGAPYDEEKLLSYFGRIQYNFNEKYLMNATMRADGSSKIDPGNRWGYFPSVPAGWVISTSALWNRRPLS